MALILILIARESHTLVLCRWRERDACAEMKVAISLDFCYQP